MEQSYKKKVSSPRCPASQRGKEAGLFLTAFLTALLVFTFAVTAAESPQVQPQGLNHAGIYALRQIDPSLTGSGVRFGVICRSITYINGEPQNDYRPYIRHKCFDAARVSFYDQLDRPAGVSLHSTAICSILLGNDPNAFNPRLGKFYFQGAAPDAQADVYELWHFLIDNLLSYTPPDVDIVVTGFGSQYEDWWTRGFEVLAEHYGIIVVAGIGNGLNANDPVLYPGAGANAIGVGVLASVDTKDLAVNLANFALAYPEHSSFGPTVDGRCKPDIVAAGNLLAADANQNNRYEPTGDWSSFSTPTVAGAVGLLVQKAKEEPNLSLAVSPDGGNCVVKAILLNSAAKLPFWHKGRLSRDDDHLAPLDFIQGAGMLNAVGAYEHLISGRKEPGVVSITGWDLNLVDKSENPQNSYEVTLAEPANKIITATVVWNRHYNNFYPFEPVSEKDANLRLELWAIDTNDPNNNYLLDYSDSSVDNVEHIYTAADADYTDYEVVVSYSNADDANEVAARQRYGLAWNAAVKQKDDSFFWYDLNADGIVNESDIIILMNNILKSNESNEDYLLGDVNSDGAIDVNDLQIFMSRNNLKAGWYEK